MIILGDMNARIGNKDKSTEPPIRIAIDEITNGQGKFLLNFLNDS